MVNSVTWKIGGEAGFGIMSSGLILSRIFSRLGYHILATNEYPSLIRGGHNLITVRIATSKFECLNRQLDILVALNRESVSLHMSEMNPDTRLVFDPDDHDWQEHEFKILPVLFPLPLSQIVKDQGGVPVMRNTVAIGATLALVGADFSYLENILSQQFGHKGEDVVKQNVGVARAGFDYIKNKYSNRQSLVLDKPQKQEKQLVINGSEAVGVAAVRSGLKFAAIYPMTPINSLITYLADHEKKYGLVYKQPEDEIAGINMAIGASLTGVRSMVATSGGGFALMVEGLSMTGIMEVPLVIDLGMRVGPATGMPTWSEQGELKFVISAGHGEFARAVLAPGDAGEVFDTTTLAFDLADKYQIPVFILTDKYLNESHWCVPYSHFAREVEIDRGQVAGDGDLKADGSFKRYSLNTPDGVSKRSFMGMKRGYYVANSYEHDEFGIVTEDAGARSEMTLKRMKKINALAKEVLPPRVYGEADSEVVFIGWGTVKGPVLEAMKILEKNGHKTRFIHYSWVFPFATAATKKLLSGARRIIDVENNATGQLASLLMENTGIAVSEKILKFDGRPFYPEEIVGRIKL